MKPDDGLFEKIQHRLAVRRAMRIGAIAAVGIAVAGGALWLALSHNATVDQPQVAMVSETATPVAEAENTVAPMPVAEAKDVERQHVDAMELLPVASQADEVAIVVPEETTTWFTIEEIDSMIRELENAAPKQDPVVQTEAAEPEKETEVAVSAPAAPKAGTPMPHYDNVLWAPNVIIPDGDIEENRTFVIKATSQLTDFKLHIYNRSGRRVYLTSDPQFMWDGTMNGARVPQGAYVWVATFRDSDGVARQEKGTVTVLR